MSEIKEQFVGYEISLKLKELGFDEKCLGMYGSEFEFVVDESSWRYAQISKDVLQAPLWQQCLPFLDDNGVIIGIIFVDNVFKYTLNTENYVSNGFKDRKSVIKSATEHATNYLWNKKFNK